MIVADSNLIAYLHLPGPKADIAEKVLMKDSHWCVPPLWKSEFRSILFAYMRMQNMSFAMAKTYWTEALDFLNQNQIEPDPLRVLEKAITSKLRRLRC